MVVSRSVLEQDETEASAVRQRELSLACQGAECHDDMLGGFIRLINVTDSREWELHVIIYMTYLHNHLMPKVQALYKTPGQLRSQQCRIR
jgi:hypothetical protein